MRGRSMGAILGGPGIRTSGIRHGRRHHRPDQEASPTSSASCATRNYSPSICNGRASSSRRGQHRNGKTSHGAGSECAVCRTSAEWFEHPYARGSQMVLEIDDPQYGKMLQPGINAPVADSRSCPAAGAEAGSASGRDPCRDRSPVRHSLPRQRSKPPCGRRSKACACWTLHYPRWPDTGTDTRGIWRRRHQDR